MRFIVVTTKQGESIRGVRRFTLRSVVALDHAEILSAEEPRPLAGRVEIPRENVALVQRLPEPRPQAMGAPA